jgi:hypothetical protein
MSTVSLGAFHEIKNQRRDVLQEIFQTDDSLRIQHDNTRTTIDSTFHFNDQTHSERLLSSSEVFINTLDGICVTKSLVYSR